METQQIKSTRITRLDELLPCKTRFISILVVGDCLEGAGIEHGGSFLVDTCRMPRIPQQNDYKHDIVLCYARVTGTNKHRVMVKQYLGVDTFGQTVATCPKGKMGHAFVADAILGTACAYYKPNGDLVWERDLSNHPEELGRERTIKDGNCSFVARTKTAAQQ